MPVRTAEAEWKGTLLEGKGEMAVGSGSFKGPFDFKSRSADGKGTNPEELIAAAHAGCYSMALSAILTQAHKPPERIHTSARVHFEKQETGFAIPRIDLSTQAVVPELDEATFREYAETAKRDCPVSKALASVDIHLDARLVTSAPARV
jgi:osmotically inducible protein OsmC